MRMPLVPGVEHWKGAWAFILWDQKTLDILVPALAVWSAALPAIFDVPGARLWNGRALTEQEKFLAREALLADGPQAALEYLSTRPGAEGETTQ